MQFMSSKSSWIITRFRSTEKILLNYLLVLCLVLGYLLIVKKFDRHYDDKQKKFIYFAEKNKKFTLINKEVKGFWLKF